MRISEAGIGQEFIVRSVLIAREVGRRLADMGFTDGARGRVIRRGAFHGPFQIRIRDYDVLIRRCEASFIEVEPVGPISADRAPSESASLDPMMQGGRRGRRAFGRRGRRAGLRGGGDLGVKDASSQNDRR